MSKYNEQHATTMLNALQGTETLKRFKKHIREEVIAEAKKKIAFEEKWLIKAIQEDKGHYLYNIDIAFNGIYHSLEQLKENK